MSANLDCTDPAPCRGAHQVSLFAPRRWGELSPLLARARMNRRIIFSVMTRSRPSLRWALIPGRIINLARNNATCKCGQDLCMRRMKSCSAPKPFDQRARVSRMLSNCTEALSVLFHTRERDRDWAIYWSSLGQIVSQLRRAHRQPRDEKQSLLVLCVDRTLNADWLIVPAALGHSPAEDVREPKKRLQRSFDWLIDVWDFNLVDAFLRTAVLLIEIWFPLIIIVRPSSTSTHFFISSPAMMGW